MVYDLSRFREAQRANYSCALSEIRAGRKTSAPSGCWESGKRRRTSAMRGTEGDPQGFEKGGTAAAWVKNTAQGVKFLWTACLARRDTL